MRVPWSWLAEFVDLTDVPAGTLATTLVDAGLKVEHVEEVGHGIDNVVVARVQAIEELTGFKKPIRWVTLDDGRDSRQVICGATNFAVGDLVAYARPPATLPGGIDIGRRPAYGRESDGMICSARELGLGDDHSGILTLGSELTPGADVVDALQLRDHVLDLAINPDRGYALSIRGVAREAALALGRELRDPAAVDVPASGAGYPARIDDEAGCDRYVARAVHGIAAGATSPWWLQRRLALAGMRSISLVVDVTNHVMLEVGHPLHAFDRAKLRGDIVVRRASAGEPITTLDGVSRALSADDLVIADDRGPIAIAGVMGGADTEVDGTTTDVVIEAAHFDPVSIAYTARRHRLPSEASRRYERGVDDALAPAAAELAAAMLARLGGADISAPATDVDRRSERAAIHLDPAHPGRLAGLNYPADVVRDRLAAVGCTVATEPGPDWSVRPPSWRPDLVRAVDLIEEVVRLEGYDRLPSTVPRAPTGRGLTRDQRLRRTLARAAVAAGLVEVVSMPFVAPDVADRMVLGADDDRRAAVRLANPVNAEEPLLRASLLPGLFACVGRNIGRGFNDLALVEIGTVVRGQVGSPAPRPPAGLRPDAGTLAAMDGALPHQPLLLAAVFTGRREPRGWWGPARDATWADAVELARELASAIGVSADVEPDALPPWHPGRCARIEVAGAVVGHAGELHPRVLEAFDLPPRTSAVELEVAPLLAAAPDVIAGPSVSTYPPHLLDVAVVVAEEVPAAHVEAALRAGGGSLLEDVRLFDVYRGEQVDPGHRSLAYTLRLRAPDRTVSAEDARAVRDAAVAAAAQSCGARLRG